MAFVCFYRGRFLNRRGHHAGAYVIADVDLEAFRDDTNKHVAAVLTVSDCARITTLDFFSEDRRTMANALHKAHSLQTVVNDFVEALEAAGDESGLS